MFNNCSLRDSINNLNNYKANINKDWSSEDIVFLNNLIDNIIRKLSSLELNIENLYNDIAITEDEIRREDEAAAAAAAAAAEAAKNSSQASK